MGNARMLKSVNQLSELTGRDRRTVKKQLEELHFVLGEKSAHLYESSEALPLIYRVDNIESARAKQALSQASLTPLKKKICARNACHCNWRSMKWIRCFKQWERY